jgi:hypothetical protein
MELDPRLQQAIKDNIKITESVAREFSRCVPNAELDECRSITREALVRTALAWLAYCEARGFDPWDADDPSIPDQPGRRGHGAA